MAPADGPLRLDTVVYRRDRFVEAAGMALFTALAVLLIWLLVLICFWGLFGLPWVAVAIGLACTAAVIRWGARLGRGSLRRARGTPYLVVTGREMLVGHPADSGLAQIPWDAIRVVAIDAPTARQRRADRVRFPVGVSEEGPVGWLYCPDESCLVTIGLGVERTPNVAILFSRPMFIGAETAAKVVPGFLVAVTDPQAAREAFTGRVPVRHLVEADLDGICSVEALPAQRLGQHGLREVRGEDRVRARIVDMHVFYAVFLLLLLWLVPARNQLPGAIATFLLAWFCCDVPSTALTGQTLGRYLVGLRVVRIEDGSARLGPGRALTRSLLRFLNGSAGALAWSLADGDAVGRVAPGLSLAKGIGAGTIVVPDGEYKRMRSGMSARERERVLTETVSEIEDWEPTATRRAAWISVVFVLLLAGTVVVYFAVVAPGPGSP